MADKSAPTASALSPGVFVAQTTANNVNRSDVLENILGHEKARWASIEAQLRSCQDLVHEIRASSSPHRRLPSSSLQSSSSPLSALFGLDSSAVSSRSASAQSRASDSTTADGLAAKIAAMTHQCAATKQECIAKEVAIRGAQKSIDALQRAKLMLSNLGDNIHGISKGLALHVQLNTARVQLLKGLLDRLSTLHAEALKESSSAKENRRELTNALSTVRTHLQRLSGACAAARTSVADNAAVAGQLQVDVNNLTARTSGLAAQRSEEEEALRALEEQLATLRRALQLEKMKPPSARRPSTPSSVSIRVMRETMALLKSAVVSFATDLKRIFQRRRLSDADLEKLFKEGLNEVKISLGFVLPPEHRGAFAKQCEVWPVTAEMVQSQFPRNRLEPVHCALHDMVLAWDGLPLLAKQRLTTARDVENNADVLHILACHVEAERQGKWQPIRGPINLSRQAAEMYRRQDLYLPFMDVVERRERREASPTRPGSRSSRHSPATPLRTPQR